MKNRGFVFLWSGQLLSTFAIWSLRTVLLIWTYSIAHSGTAVSMVGLAETIPILILAPLGGVFIDRWPRALIMSGGMAAAVLILLPVLAVSGSAILPAIIAAALFVNAAVQLSYSAASAAIPVVVGREGMARANSLTTLIYGGVAVVGPGLAALLTATLGPHGAVLLMSAIFAAAGIVYLMVPAPRAVRTEPAGSLRHELMGGLSYVFRSRLLLSLTVLSFTTGLSFGGLSVLDVVFVTRALHRSAGTVGLLLSAAGFGELVGGIIMTAMVGWLARFYHRVLGISLLLAGTAFVTYSASRTLAVAVAALAVASFSFPPLNVAFMTLRQGATVDAFMGRVTSLASTTQAIATLISLSIVGALTDLLGVRAVIAAGGSLLLLAGALSLVLLAARPVTVR